MSTSRRRLRCEWSRFVEQCRPLAIPTLLLALAKASDAEIDDYMAARFEWTLSRRHRIGQSQQTASPQTEAVCSTRRRPSVVVVDDCRVHIHMHDEWFHRERARLVTARNAAHPDKGGSTSAFLAASAVLMRFLDAERHWYWKHGKLSPPGRKKESIHAA